MNNKKQSSIEWLVEMVSKMGYISTDILEQAKAMHRSEIEDAYDRKVINEKQNWFIRDGKHYYDLHYAKEQNSSASIEKNI
jgi:hypothetical protein